MTYTFACLGSSVEDFVSAVAVRFAGRGDSFTTSPSGLCFRFGLVGRFGLGERLGLLRFGLAKLRDRNELKNLSPSDTGPLITTISFVGMS
jgi:hypothetical protein